MKRMQLALSPRQVEKLNELKSEWGLSFAETVRRVLDASPIMHRGKKIISDLLPTGATGYDESYRGEEE